MIRRLSLILWGILLLLVSLFVGPYLLHKIGDSHWASFGLFLTSVLLLASAIVVFMKALFDD